MLNFFQSIWTYVKNLFFKKEESYTKSDLKKLESAAKCFCNDSYQKKDADINKAIYIVHIDKYLSLTLKENLVAKRIQKQTGLKIRGICATFYNKKIETIDNLFQTESISMVILFLKKIYLCFIPLFCALHFLVKDATAEGLIKIKYKGIPIGNPVYDQIILNKVDNKEGFTFHKITLKRGFIELFEAMCLVELSKSIFEKVKPQSCIISENSYNRSIIARVAVKYGADIINTLKWDTYISRCSEVKNMELNVRQPIVDNVLDGAYSNFEDFITPQYDQLSEKKDIWLDKNKIEKGKKNVVIFVHCFKDCPREQSPYTIYNNFYDWFVDTIRYIKKLPDVNWIIKDHPYSKAYHQQEEVLRLFKENKVSNLYYIPNHNEENWVPFVADCVITVSGTICIEAPSYGVPCITAGNSFYEKFGMIISAQNKKEYYSMLSTVSKIPIPDDMTRQKAKELMARSKRQFQGMNDEMGAVFNEYNKVMFSGKVTARMQLIAEKKLIEQFSTLVCNAKNFEVLTKYNNKMERYLKDLGS